MEDNRKGKCKKKGAWWKGLPLTTDYLMSGSFVRLFVIFLICSTALFFLFWWMTSGYSKWNPGEAFIQLTNPARNLNDKEPDPGASEWIAIVLMNLYGLFVVNGIILTIFVNWITNRKARHAAGLARYSYIQEKRFAVIIGAHKMVSSLASALINKTDIDFVLIQTQRNPELVRKEIYAQINDRNLAQNVIVYAGDRTSWHELKDLELEKAKEVYLIGETSDIDGSSHDAFNMQCWSIIAGHLNCGREVKIPFHVMFEYQSTFSAFQITDIDVNQNGVVS